MYLFCSHSTCQNVGRPIGLCYDVIHGNNGNQESWSRQSMQETKLYRHKNTLQEGRMKVLCELVNWQWRVQCHYGCSRPLWFWRTENNSVLRHFIATIVFLGSSGQKVLCHSSYTCFIWHHVIHSCKHFIEKWSGEWE